MLDKMGFLLFVVGGALWVGICHGEELFVGRVVLGLTFGLLEMEGFGVVNLDPRVMT